VTCAANDATVAAAFGLAAAVSENRHEDVIRLGQRLLEGEHGPALLQEGEAAFYLMGAMQYAALSAGQPELAQQLVQRYWTRMDRQAQGSGSLRLLALLASRAEARSTPQANQ